MTRVAILGGGVGGLSAAHELIERGFDVTVYEARDAFGGKARSMDVPGSGTDGRPDLPGEHGFRFFPGFYWHVTHTMKRIPYGTGTVYDNLEPTTEMLMAQDASVPGSSGVEIPMPMSPPKSLGDVLKSLRTLQELLGSLEIPLAEYALYVRKIIGMMTSCDARRLNEFEDQDWLEYVEATKDHPERSPDFMKFLAIGMTRSLVAAKAEDISARTGGTVLCQLLYDTLKLDGRVANVLNGPTSEVWIDPWLDYLRNRGVKFRSQCRVGAIQFDGVEVTSVTISDRNGDEGVDEIIDAEYYIAAMPVEKFEPLVTDAMKEKAPELSRLRDLKTDWMTGVMFYLDKNVDLNRGHSIYVDSEWCLTAISQAQFWKKGYLEERGDGRVEGVLSVDVSAWDVKGRKIKKAAEFCTEEEIYEEVWDQLVRHIDDGQLDRSNVIATFIDPAVEFRSPARNYNDEPLLINKQGTWKYRPKAVTAIPNLFLAADFVQTNTDLATMEAANEAARAAVNGILTASGSAHEPCKVRPLREPWIFWPFRQFDRLLYRFGRNPPVPFTVTDDFGIQPTGLGGKAAMSALRRVDRRRGTTRFLTGK